MPLGTLVTEQNEISILVAEDNADMLTFIGNILADDYHVILVSNGREAWNKTLETIPDIVISDLMMPELDGLALCKQIATHEATNHIPVVLLTARADHQSKIEGLEYGADAYITKPFDTQELKLVVHNLIERRRRFRKFAGNGIFLEPADKEISLPDIDQLFLKKINAILEKISHKPFGIEALTEELEMSRMQLHRKIKALTGLSPGEFLRNYKLEKAKKLLCTSGMHIGDVAYQVGFSSLSTFVPLFKEYTGLTPTEYINLHATEKV